MGTNLITGGLGFIGFHLTRLLRQQGEDVVIFDVVSRSRLSDAFEGTVKIVQGDLTNLVHVLEAVKDNDIDCIYHAGAMLPPVTEQRPSAAYAVNVTGTLNILEAARLLGVGSVIYPSTLAVFGRDVPSVVPNDARQRPPNMYGVTKVCCERLGEYYYTRYGINFRGVRFTPLLGMGRFDSAQSAYTYRSVQESALGRPYTIYVDRNTRIALLYVKDGAQGLIDLKRADEERLTERVYNLYGLSLTAQELADSIRKFVPNAQVDFKPDPEMIRLVENLPARLDDSLARKDWGWAPRYSLEQAVKDFIDDIRQHTRLYE